MSFLRVAPGRCGGKVQEWCNTKILARFEGGNVEKWELISLMEALTEAGEAGTVGMANAAALRSLSAAMSTVK
jgi:hypothetical protein